MSVCGLEGGGVARTGCAGWGAGGLTGHVSLELMLLYVRKNGLSVISQRVSRRNSKVIRMSMAFDAGLAIPVQSNPMRVRNAFVIRSAPFLCLEWGARPNGRMGNHSFLCDILKDRHNAHISPTPFFHHAPPPSKSA